MKFFKSLLFSFLFLTGGCAEAEDDGQNIIFSQQADFRIAVIAEDLNHPWALAFLPGGDFLVTERHGKLWRITTQGQKTEITGVPKVYHEGQGGLLDILPEPGFQDQGWVYFTYAAAAEADPDLANTELARARLDLKQNRLRDTEVLFRALPKVEGGNHWGSRLLFTKEGLLFMTLGERFDYKEEAQDPANHLGTIVRLTREGEIPQDNPFAGQAGKSHPEAMPEIYSYGHRNPQGIALHPESGRVWSHEHGPKGGDEINILKPGANYGWPAVTFGISYWGMQISDKTSAPGMEDPVLQWTPSIAPSGMAFYSDDKFPQWQGDLFVGALAGKHLRRLELEGDKVIEQEVLLHERGERIRDVRNGPDGYLYILTDEADGRLYRLEPL